jgi:hypothetical protein
MINIYEKPIEHSGHTGYNCQARMCAVVDSCIVRNCERTSRHIKWQDCFPTKMVYFVISKAERASCTGPKIEPIGLRHIG